MRTPDSAEEDLQGPGYHGAACFGAGYKGRNGTMEFDSSRPL